MKKITILAFLAFASVACSSENEATEKTEEVAHEHAYSCPMECEGDKTYAEAGKCPVCEMDLAEAKTTEE